MSDGSYKRIVIVSLVLLILVGSGIGAFFYLSPQNNEKVKEESLTLGLMPGETEELVYIAKDLGYFKANNLNVTIKNYTTGLVAVNGLLNHEVDIATATDFVVVGKALDNRSVTTIGTIDKYANAYLVVRTDRGIHQVSDLIGKKIGVPMGTVAQFNLGRFLELNGIDIAQVKLVNVPIASAVTALKNGSVDAVMTSTTYIDAVGIALPGKVLEWPAQSETLTYYVSVTNSSWATGHPETIKRFLNALDQAESVVVHNADQARKILADNMNNNLSYAVKVWTDHQYSLTLEQSLILRMEDQSRWMIRNNLTTSPVPNFLDHIYVDGLESVDPGSVDIIR